MRADFHAGIGAPFTPLMHKGLLGAAAGRQVTTWQTSKAGKGQVPLGTKTTVLP